MLDKFKDMGNLIKKAKEMQAQMNDIQKELKGIRITEETAEGKIRVVMTGEMDVVEIVVDESLYAPGNAKKVNEALKVTVAKAIKKAKDLATSKLAKASGGLVPGM